MINRSNRKFFSRLSYSLGNEDPDIERRALSIQPSDRVICITASGDRPLHLLLDDCAEIVAVDLNETQNHLLELKMKAMENLNFESYLAFLGGTKDAKRTAKIEGIISQLSPKAKLFWNHQKRLITKGVLYQGATEKLCKTLAIILNILRRKKVRRLFEIDDLEEQRRFVKEEWDSFFWRKSLNILFNTRFCNLFLKDPGLSGHLGETMSPGQFLHESLNKILTLKLAKESPIASLICRGRLGLKAMPPYLTQKGTEVIKSRLHKISWETRDIVEFLEESPPESFNCFSMSDIASYMSKDHFYRLLKAIHRTAKPGARFSIRQFMSDHPIPPRIAELFSRDSSLEKTLESEECCSFYRFMAGTIQK